MTHSLQLRVDPRTATNQMLITAEISRLMNIDANRIKKFLITKKSIDARQRRIMVNLNVQVYLDSEPISPQKMPV